MSARARIHSIGEVLRAFTEGQYRDDPHYGLINHRLHRLLPKSTGAVTFHTPSGVKTSEEIADEAGKKLARIHNPQETARVMSLWRRGDYLGAAGGDPAEARAQEKFHNRFPSLNADDVNEGNQQAQHFYTALCGAILEGNHGHGVYRDHVAGMLDSLAVSALPFGDGNASFRAGRQHNPAGGHALIINPLMFGVAAKKLEGKDPTSDWHGNEQLLSAEAVIAHEMAHFLDWTTSGSQVAAMYGSNPPPHPTYGVYMPRLTLLRGQQFTPLHAALERYTTNPGGRLLLPFLPPNFTRLHYPTAGTPKGGYTDNEKTHLIGTAMAEWPTVTTELALHEPSALTALDRVAGMPNGHTADLVNDFWGFPLAGQPDERRAAMLTDMLSSALNAQNGPKREFFTADQTSARLAPLAAARIKNYADAGNTMPDKDVLYTRWGDAYRLISRKDPRQMTEAERDADVDDLLHGTAVYGPLVLTPLRSPEHLREVIRDIRENGTASTGTAYLRFDHQRHIVSDVLLTGDALHGEIEAAYYGLGSVSLNDIMNHHKKLPDRPGRFPEVPTAQNNYCGVYGPRYVADSE